MGKKFLNKTNITNKLEQILKYPYFYLILMSIPFFLMVTNYYFPFGGQPFLEVIFDLDGPMWFRMDMLFSSYPENILWVVLIFFVLHFVVPRKHWRWIGYTYLGVIILLLITYGF